MKKELGEQLKDAVTVKSLIITILTDIFIARKLDCELIPNCLREIANDYEEKWKEEAMEEDNEQDN